LSNQHFDNPIRRAVPRKKAQKWIRVIRGILSHCSRTQYREIVKSALRSPNIHTKLEALKAIDFSKIETFGKTPNADVYKFVTFQAIQYLGLIDPMPRKVYTKHEAMWKVRFLERTANFTDYEFVATFIHRKEPCESDLSKLTQLVQLCLEPPSDVEIIQFGDKSMIYDQFGRLDVHSEQYQPVQEKMR
jgi:hypothetical protein